MKPSPTSDEPAANETKSPGKRSWAMRWSLRVFVVLISLACIAFAVAAHWMRQGQIHEDVAEKIRPLGGIVTWELTRMQPVAMGTPQTGTKGNAGLSLGFVEYELKGGPDWMRTIGVEPAFQRIEHVWLMDQREEHLAAFLHEIERLGSVKGVGIFDAPVTEKQLERLLDTLTISHLTISQTDSIGGQRMPFLRDSQLALLSFNDVPLTDTVLDDLPDTLTHFSATNTNITDAGLDKFVQRKNLKDLVLDQTPTSEAAIEDLREKMPWCEIKWGPARKPKQWHQGRRP